MALKDFAGPVATIFAANVKESDLATADSNPHIRTNPSSLALKNRRLSGLNWQAQILFACPPRTMGVSDGSFAPRFHSRSVASSLPVTSHRLSRLIAARVIAFR